MIFNTFIILVTAIYIFILELSKNTLLGWAIGIALAIALLCIKSILKEKDIWNGMIAGGFFLVLLACFAINYNLSAPQEKLVPAVTYRNPIVTKSFHVAQGDLSGVYNEDKSVEIFAGIPYAKPPVGDLRWREPQEPDSWAGIRACDTYGPKAMQPSSSELYSSLSQILGTNDYQFSLNDQYKPAMSEDCLYLNVYRPADYDGEPLPVVFFVHGGSLTTGESFYTEYRGESFAKKGVIFVNFAYRLGVFGYMANEELAAECEHGTTGDYGLLDQIMALKWVHENIGVFGGDPDNITIAGESAGSSSVNALCVSPLTEGLFVRAIAESSGISMKKPYHTFREMDEALETGKEVLREFGAKNINELRKIDARKLVTTNTQNSSMCVDGYAIVEQPYLTYEKGENHEQALLNGSNLKEADAFLLSTKATSENYKDILEGDILGQFASEAVELVPPGSVERDKYFIIDPKGDAKGALSYVYSDAWFSYSHNVWSKYMEAQGKPVYQYFFTKTNNYLSNNHAGEMVYAYGNLDYHPGMYDESDYALSEIMQTYWTNFAKTGDPNKGSENSELELPNWPVWNYEEDKLLELNDEIKLIDNPYHELNKIIDKYQESED